MKKIILAMLVGALGALSGIYIYFSSIPSKKIPTQESISQSIAKSSLAETTLSSAAQTQETYMPKTFAIMQKPPKGLTHKQLSAHNDLYKGYVKARNTIEKSLNTVDRSNPNRSYTPFRALKVAETFAMNGQLLHELYFENLSDQERIPLEKTREHLVKHFGSLEKFKADLLDTASVARGWAVTCYCLNTGSIKNFLFDEHNVYVPIMAIPLIIVDVYEHAYMIDYGIDRTTYLDILWKHLDWDVIEKRFTRWVEKLSSL